MQRDPLGYVDGMNLYQYTMSSPINLLDPDGTAPRGFFSSFAVVFSDEQVARRSNFSCQLR